MDEDDSFTGPRAYTVTETVAKKLEKPRFGLLPWKALESAVAVMEFGAKKHSKNGWMTVPDAYEVYKEAAARHLAAIMKGEVNDPETGEPHASHLACCALIMAHFAK